MNNVETKGSQPTPEEIAALAYDIWQKGGCKPGSDLENWLQAEKQLSHRRVAAPSDTAKSNQRLTVELPQAMTSQSGSTQTNHLRRATNVRLQNHLART